MVRIYQEEEEEERVKVKRKNHCKIHHILCNSTSSVTVASVCLHYVIPTGPSTEYEYGG